MSEPRAKIGKQQRIEVQKRIAALRAREAERINQAKRQGTVLDSKDEVRRARFVKQGIDPDDRAAFSAAGYVAGSGCGGATLMLLVLLIVLAAIAIAHVRI